MFKGYKGLSRGDIGRSSLVGGRNWNDREVSAMETRLFYLVMRDGAFLFG